MMVGFCFFFFNDTATTEIYTLSLHDALPLARSRTVVHDQKSMAAIDGLLALIEMQKASGLVLVTGEVPALLVGGATRPLSMPPVEPAMFRALLDEVFAPEQWDRLREQGTV